MSSELLTVKEYAARQGITEQAAYKQIRTGKIKTIEKREKGKPKKYIVYERNEPEPEEKQPPQGDALPADPKEALEKAVEALTAQLAKKDEQIEQQARTIDRLTTLLDQSHQLQALSQTLLAQATTDTQQEEPPAIETDEAPKGHEVEPQEAPAVTQPLSIWQRFINFLNS